MEVDKILSILGSVQTIVIPAVVALITTWLKLKGGEKK